MKTAWTTGVAVGSVLVGLCGSMLAQQPPPLLDLTAVRRHSPTTRAQGGPPSIERGKAEEIRGGVGSGIRAEKLPVAVTLRSIDPNPCVWGEDIVYELDVANTGPKGLILPWSLSRNDVLTGVKPQTYRELTVTIVMDDGSEVGVLLGPASAAFGSDSSPGTLRTLSTGERVRVRAPGVCRPGTSPATQAHVRETFADPVSVYVRLSLQTEPRVVGKFAKSSALELSILTK